MKRAAIGFLVAFVGVGSVASCSSGDVEEQVASTWDELTKCQDPGAVGASNYCNDPACPCDQGEGDCDSAAQCSGDLRCSGKGTYFGYPTDINVCAPAHCNNKRLDGNETEVDCGGSCGTSCPGTTACMGLPPNGETGHCTSSCPCAAGEGSCVSTGVCQSGLVCEPRAGIYFGFDASVNICVGAHCGSGALDGDETGIDCGGSCRPCTGGSAGANGLGGAGIDTGMDMAFDATGNVFAAGRFSGTVDFGGGSLTSAGLTDIFLVKLSPTGQHIWSQRFGGAGPDGDAAVQVAVDGTGNVYLAGNFYDSANFGGGALSAGDSADAFVAKFDSTGAHQWSQRFGGARGDKVNGLAVANGGAVYITGAFQESITFGSSTFASASAGLTDVWDMFVAKLSTSGAHLWSAAFGTTGDEQGTDIAVEYSTGNAMVAGYFAGTVDFGTGPITSSGSTDAVAMELVGNTGLPVWVRSWGGDSDDRSNGIDVGSNGNPVVVGRFKRTVDFGAGPVASTGGTDVFVVSLNGTDGVPVWSKAFGGALDEHAIDVAVRRSTNEAAVTGYFRGSMDPGTGVLTSAGSDDVFVMSLSSAGAINWASSYGGTGSDFGFGVDWFAPVVGVVGRYDGSISFGTSSLSSAGNSDIFIARLVN